MEMENTGNAFILLKGGGEPALYGTIGHHITHT